ncbi:hypothetical protein Nepgr_006303 [Nepenthes gracilis]|uniref:Uncharacterized protein n=1 Tax=Nepenthes gracilis TaxID=150966 RepID=A0AAD3S569_NEPGR|nr:hypothetical protein Nepgr_006303 [Nepenthes gracilis]
MTSNTIIKPSKAVSSDLNSTNDSVNRSRRSRNEGSNHGSSPFKGVVLQQNGHWGAQIYADHQRIWLGTFKTEREAAMAYDSAAIKLRCGDFHRNFPWTSFSVHEPRFQSQYATDAVLNMIKDGSYQSKFLEFLRSHSQKSETGPTANVCSNDNGVLYQELFQKELTPSDVGKLNRLVIPKKYAVKYFPPLCQNSEVIDKDGDSVGDTQLVFHDRLMRAWKFRYCYWKSSQSYVFTRGWNRFVKEKNLKAKDVVTFYKAELRDLNSKDLRAVCVIDVGYSGGGESSGVEQPSGAAVESQLGAGTSCDSSVKDAKKASMGEEIAHEKGFKLFGVTIG